MSFFDILLKTHSFPKGVRYLWTLKLTSDEHNELKACLRDAGEKGRLRFLSREAALYYSQWWRCEYDGGHASIGDVCRSLFGSEDLKIELYLAAKEGARKLNLQIIRTSGQCQERESTRYSLYYNGGLPMQYIYREMKESGERSHWGRFFRALVWDAQDYSTIPGSGKIASLCDSLKAFCASLQQANVISDAPFNPVGYSQWWEVFFREIKDERQRMNARNPMSFKWLLHLNDILHKIDSPSFRITGPRELSEEFVKKQGLEKNDFVSLSVCVNGVPYPLAEYNKNSGRFHSRRSIDKIIACNTGDTVEIVLNDCGPEGIVLATRSLDFSDPQVLHMDDGAKNIFTICDVNKMASEDCIIICTDDWECSSLVSETYVSPEGNLKVFRTNPDSVPVKLESHLQGTKALDPKVALTWTVIDEGHALQLTVPSREKLYNADGGLVFYEQSNERRSACHVLYASHGRRDWSRQPKLGRIRAKVMKDNNVSVDSVPLVNSGQLDIKCLDSNWEECVLQIDWAYGEVKCDGADMIAKNVWKVKRDRLEDSRYVPVNFTPQPTKGSPFRVLFLAPFFGFQVFDYNGSAIEDGGTIPVSDLDSCRYYFHRHDTMTLQTGVGEKKDGVKHLYSERDDGKGVNVTEIIANLNRKGSSIPREGRLASLFIDGSEQVSTLMDRQNEPLPAATATIWAESKSDGFSVSYHLKDFPYRLGIEGDNIVVKDHPGMLTYNNKLYALPFDDPFMTPVELPAIGNGTEKYSIPTIISSSNQAGWLVFGEVKGYILPWALFTAGDKSKKERESSREESIRNIKEELRAEPLFSEVWIRAAKWFDLVQDGCVPGSSVLILEAIADDRKLLGKFAMQIYLKCHMGTSDEEVISYMMDFQKQMSFIWAWADGSDSLKWMQDIGNAELQSLKPLYWRAVTEILKNDESTWGAYLFDESKMPDMIAKHFKDLWLKTLKKDSIPEKKLEHPDTHQNGGDERLSDEAQRVFAFVRMTMLPDNSSSAGASVTEDEMIARHDERLRKMMSMDDLWICERRKLDEMLREMDLSQIMEICGLPDKEDIKREIKKSTLFGLRFKVTTEIYYR